MITFIEAFQKELATEAPETRKMLALVPADKMNWQPHPKSMTLKALATHLADIPSWIGAILEMDDWDIAQEVPEEHADAEALLATFDKNVQKSQDTLSRMTDDILLDRWVLRGGDQVYMDMPKWEAVRHAFGQNAHHRAQLGVFLRLLDIPISGPYGPSADEMEMMMANETN
ncbi:DinB family protein [Persicitalea jodogahamensis]|uniref:Damage-inducible protein DinB n=1 Tax=Persicitalea jodogahamensis TaxID=402147 RepID=A0A8J3D488_9BACT|nr:DinB family protein [Persicitalea jodogahamensis]GHB80707.1 hypothetical protein GCM10007390_38940 [Persicitalea jodogahamensis]